MIRYGYFYKLKDLGLRRFFVIIILFLPSPLHAFSLYHLEAFRVEGPLDHYLLSASESKSILKSCQKIAISIKLKELTTDTLSFQAQYAPILSISSSGFEQLQPGVEVGLNYRQYFGSKWQNCFLHNRVLLMGGYQGIDFHKREKTSYALLGQLRSSKSEHIIQIDACQKNFFNSKSSIFESAFVRMRTMNALILPRILNDFSEKIGLESGYIGEFFYFSNQKTCKADLGIWLRFFSVIEFFVKSPVTEKFLVAKSAKNIDNKHLNYSFRFHINFQMPFWIRSRRSAAFQSINLRKDFFCADTFPLISYENLLD